MDGGKRRAGHPERRDIRVSMFVCSPPFGSRDLSIFVVLPLRCCSLRPPHRSRKFSVCMRARRGGRVCVCLPPPPKQMHVARRRNLHLFVLSLQFWCRFSLPVSSPRSPLIPPRVFLEYSAPVPVGLSRCRLWHDSANYVPQMDQTRQNGSGLRAAAHHGAFLGDHGQPRGGSQVQYRRIRIILRVGDSKEMGESSLRCASSGGRELLWLTIDRASPT